jgi:hypothetical protein|tara:strand:- start:2390 stop:2587 length:198 start_codon:yes stop_codon:yes gene_type:complete
MRKKAVLKGYEVSVKGDKPWPHSSWEVIKDASACPDIETARAVKEYHTAAHGTGTYKFTPRFDRS